ncbi:uncharacterized protein PAC_19049 [Phialocephala subalpina]|uniref:NAD-dependent epimerase/dehydratase domain-containing protein n=1 Tax=Phialocephala subalpina TaxID=576137 RepID=A0A1L7XVY4_9HELO|nr:uncharacterized protein PAC_19049 [Phialocephala subalpina]
MPNVLIIGAAGYIGSALRGQLPRSGNHRVFGLAKSEQEGFKLQLNEIIPLFGNLDEVQSCMNLVLDTPIDIIVDTNSFNNEATKLEMLDILVQAAKERLCTVHSQQSFKISKIGFVTVSGIWGHGSTEDPCGSFKPARLDSLGTSPPVGLPAAKARYEQKVLNAAGILDVAIVRPHFIFARGGAAWTRILSGIFEASQTGSSDIVRVPVDPESSTYSFTNIEDVASGPELAIDKIQMINGSSIYPVFDLVGDQFPIGLLIEADANIFGCKGKVGLYKPEGVAFLESIGGSSDARATRAEQILGWKARRGNFVRDTHIYASSFLASLELAKET